MASVDPGKWAQEEFGHAELGHSLRLKALVRVAGGCAERPAGKVTEVFKTAADRESAYRLVENEDIDSAAVMRAAHQAAARRCTGSSFVYVPVDKSTLSLKDWSGTKGFGMIGDSEARATGINVLTALAVAEDGIPQGIAHQRFWLRPRQSRQSKSVRRNKPLESRESYLWFEAMSAVTQTFEREAPSCRPWFQIDREGDVSSAIAWAVDGKHWLTVRGAQNRRLEVQGDDRSNIRDALESAPVLGSYLVDKSARPGETARTAIVDIRTANVTLSIPIDKAQKRRRPLAITVVLVSEPAPPEGKPALDWMLLTTYPVKSLGDAHAVVLGYAQRWRIEEFHRAWKTGSCNVEDSQLRSVDHVIRWAVLLASVAIRVIRLAYLARSQPDKPASIEFSPAEITVIRTLSKPTRPSPNPTVGQVIHWLASIGGYTGPTSSGGPPGFIVISRGLDHIQSALDLFNQLEKT